MKIKFLILTVSIFLSFYLFGQEKQKKLDFRIGSGISLLGSGDLLAFNYENELNLKLNRYFSSSLSFNLGRNNDRLASFLQGNLNIFLSPFNNVRKFDFKVGTGLTYYTISDTHKIEGGYKLNKRKSLGFNMIIENTYMITDKYLIAVKLFSQPYFNSDINSGILLKLGLTL